MREVDVWEGLDSVLLFDVLCGTRAWWEAPSGW